MVREQLFQSEKRKANVQVRICFTNLNVKNSFPRVVPSDVLFENFTSDRSHMIYSSATPPDYPAILNKKDCKTNLFSHFVTMEGKHGYGSVTDNLLQFFEEICDSVSPH
jgi:N-terminal glutamine amidase